MISCSGSDLNRCLESLAFAAEASTWSDVSAFHYVQILESIDEYSERVWNLGFRTLDEFHSYFVSTK